MSLYSYTKNNQPKEYSEHIIIDESDFQNEINAKGLLSNIYSFLKSLTNTSKLASFLVPSLFVIVGIGFIYKEFFPDIQQFIQEASGYLSQGNISPVSEQYVDLSKYISRPTDFPELTINALQEHVLLDDPVSKAYSGTFYLSIPALGFKKLPIEANVDSTNEKSYLKVLDRKLAHFKNTGLPISDVQNNIFIYAHSASPNYNPKPNDPMVAFSFLPNLKVGDDIYLEIEGKTYHYKMYKSSVVLPTDTKAITGTKGKRTLTLGTCFPLGSNDKRLIVVARPVED